MIPPAIPQATVTPRMTANAWPVPARRAATTPAPTATGAITATARITYPAAMSG
jgi:hypothetical protein